jgi:rhodanese-related sulfurtransferase
LPSDAAREPVLNSAQYLAARLAYEIDVLDVAEGLNIGSLVVIDTRKQKSWDAGHVPGARHIPPRVLVKIAPKYLPIDLPVVVYGWGPGCNGATRAAAALVELGYSVREMIGGFEYWCRSGLMVESSAGLRRHPPDPLVSAEI